MIKQTKKKKEEKKQNHEEERLRNVHDLNHDDMLWLKLPPARLADVDAGLLGVTNALLADPLPLLALMLLIVTSPLAAASPSPPPPYFFFISFVSARSMAAVTVVPLVVTEASDAAGEPWREILNACAEL